MWYLCGLGSNIAPETNLPLAVARLADRFGEVRLSPVIRTPPYGMVTERCFLNALVLFQSPCRPDQVKALFNGLEEALGRDRSDPLRSVRDRPLDVDILLTAPTPDFDRVFVEEGYFRQLLKGGPVEGVALSLNGQPLGQTTATVYRDQGAGHKVIVQQGQNLLDDAVETALPG